MSLVLLAVYAVTSIGPRGASLCLGGGHDWSEAIIAACSADHCCTEAPVEEVVQCVSCDHHQGESHGPCTDVPLDGDEARPDVQQDSLQLTTQAPLTVCVVAVSLPETVTAKILRPPAHPATDTLAQQQVRASLRAVVLLI